MREYKCTELVTNIMELVNPLYKVTNETPPSPTGSLKTPLELLDTSLVLLIIIITSVMMLVTVNILYFSGKIEHWGV